MESGHLWEKSRLKWPLTRTQKKAFYGKKTLCNLAGDRKTVSWSPGPWEAVLRGLDNLWGDVPPKIRMGMGSKKSSKKVQDVDKLGSGLNKGPAKINPLPVDRGEANKTYGPYSFGGDLLEIGRNGDDQSKPRTPTVLGGGFTVKRA